MNWPLSYVIVIATYNRPTSLRQCVAAALVETAAAAIVVVDTSPDDASRRVIEEFSGVRYLHSDAGIGHLPGSRQIGIEATESDVVVFIDDDIIQIGRASCRERV